MGIGLMSEKRCWYTAFTWKFFLNFESSLIICTFLTLTPSLHLHIPPVNCSLKINDFFNGTAPKNPFSTFYQEYMHTLIELKWIISKSSSEITLCAETGWFQDAAIHSRGLCSMTVILIYVQSAS